MRWVRLYGEVEGSHEDTLYESLYHVDERGLTPDSGLRVEGIEARFSREEGRQEALVHTARRWTTSDSAVVPASAI